MITHLLFDSGGVIVQNIMKSRTLLTAAEEQFGIDAEDFHNAYVRYWGSYELGFLSAKQFWTAVLRYLNRTDLSLENMQSLYASVIFPVVDTKKLLEALQPNYTLVLANNEAKEQDDIRDKIVDFTKYFGPRYSSWMIGDAKPNKSYFEYILNDLDINANQCLFIDDKEKNIRGAESVGIRSILFEDAEQLSEAFKERGINIGLYNRPPAESRWF